MSVVKPQSYQLSVIILSPHLIKVKQLSDGYIVRSDNPLVCLLLLQLRLRLHLLTHPGVVAGAAHFPLHAVGLLCKGGEGTF